MKHKTLLWMLTALLLFLLSTVCCGLLEGFLQSAFGITFPTLLSQIVYKVLESGAATVTLGCLIIFGVAFSYWLEKRKK